MSKKVIFKKVLICTKYLVLISLCILGIFFLIYETSAKESDNIVMAKDSYFRNINPKFLVDFNNNQSIRFETVSSYSNPFEGTEPNIWGKLRYTLGIRQEKKGIEISLIQVSYDTQMLEILDIEDIDLPQSFLESNFELISSGRKIGGSEDEVVSKDTIVAKNIYEGVDLEYQILKGKGLKEEIVLNQLPQYTTQCDSGECQLPVNRFLFKISLDDGLELKRSMDTNTQYPSGTIYVVDENNNYIAHFLSEFALDALGNKTSRVVGNISKSGTNEYIYEIILDPEWLLSADRVFPIRIDPSIVHSSEEIFNQGIFERVSMNDSLMISLDSHSSGEYISSVVDLESQSQLNGITWEGFSQSTGNGEKPFSSLGLILQDSFNELPSSKIKWGSGALQLDTLNITKDINIPISESNYKAIEFWFFPRNISNEEYIFKTELLNLLIQDGKYAVQDLNGTQYVTNIPAKYNTWEYIGILLDIQNSQVKIYVNDIEESKDIVYLNTQIPNIQFLKGNGYIDELRVYDRLVTKYEFLSNSQFTDIYLQYSTSDDSLSWSKWYSNTEYIPEIVKEEGNISFVSDIDMYSNFDILSFKYVSNSPKEMILGSNTFVNGLATKDEITLNELEGVVELTDPIKYLDVTFTPQQAQNACILSLGALEIHSLDTGGIQILTESEEDILTVDRYINNTENILSISLGETSTYIYLNGNILQHNVPNILNVQQYSKGSRCVKKDDLDFNGEIGVLRVSTTLQSNEDILGYSNISSRKYTLTPVFNASLQKDGEILGSDSLGFSILESNSLNMISNLNIGDTLVISEGSFKAQGEVLSLDQNTGFVILKSWNEGSTFPTLGYSTQATVLKWESAYILVSTYLDSNIPNLSTNMVTNLNENISDIYLFSTQASNNDILLDIKSSRYLKYKMIFVTSKEGTSSLLSSTTIEFENGGPSMDKVMRHGKWFNEGSKQSYWWVKN